MAYVKKMPSGCYKCQYYVDGKRRCVTAPTRKEAEYRALQDQLAQKRRNEEGPTVGEAIRAYIDSRDGVLSPATIAGYEKQLRNDYGPILKVPVSRLTQEVYQRFVNGLVKKDTRRGKAPSPKTVRNVCGLLHAAARYADPSVRLEAALPAPRKRVANLLSPEAVISLVRGDRIELPVLLAMWLSLSLSEIRGLQRHSVRGDSLVVQGAVVDVDGVAVRKEANKAYSRTRVLPIPPPIMKLIRDTDAWKAGEGPLVPMSGQAIYKRWVRLQESAGVSPTMTFHDLRHLNASVLMTLVPDTYAMERGGWASRQTLQNVYQHTMDSRRNEYDDRIDDFFQKLYDNDKQEKSC